MRLRASGDRFERAPQQVCEGGIAGLLQELPEEVVARPLEIRIRRESPLPQEAGVAEAGPRRVGTERDGDVVMPQRVVEAAGAILEIGQAKGVPVVARLEPGGAVEADMPAAKVAAEVRQKRGKPAPKRSRTGAQLEAARTGPDHGPDPYPAAQTTRPQTDARESGPEDTPTGSPVCNATADQRVFKREDGLEWVLRWDHPVSDEEVRLAARWLFHELSESGVAAERAEPGE